jgi:hypothetical protein
MALEDNSNFAEREMSAPSSGRQTTATHVRNVFAASASKSLLQKRWERRWTAASGTWFAALLAMIFGGTDWRAAVMVSATAFMLARAGDMLDDY